MDRAPCIRREGAPEPESAMRWIEALRDPAAPLPATMVVVAHPDDETVGAGAQLARLREALFVYLTDGAPPDGEDARRHGLSIEGYRELRGRERAAVLGSCGIGGDRISDLGCPDQQAARHLPLLTMRLARLLRFHRPGIVLTQPYEGGHPDHDATAFAVHAAVAWLRSRDPERNAPELVEMTGYHRGAAGQWQSEVFLPRSGTDHSMASLPLDEAGRRRKRALLDGFASQRETLMQFPLAVERFRRAPAYDFHSPPHEGPLFYEQHPWGMTGERFRALAANAMKRLGLEGAL